MPSLVQAYVITYVDSSVCSYFSAETQNRKPWNKNRNEMNEFIKLNEISFSVLLRCAIEYMFRFIESDTLDKYAHQNAKKETMVWNRPLAE